MDCKYITGKIKWPENVYSIDLGFKNCAGVMAHFGTPQGGLGGKASYTFTPSVDFQVMADITFLNNISFDYKLLDISVGFSTKPRYVIMNKLNILFSLSSLLAYFSVQT